MDINTFIEKLEEEFEDVEAGTLQADTSYKDIEGWDSMHALIIIAMVDIEYSITLTGEDLQKAVTIQDIFDIVKSRS